jgi:hypothetical protein
MIQQNTTKYNLARFPRSGNMREGLYSRVLSPHPPQGTGRAEAEVCHLLAITAPRINDEMTFVPTKDESFIRGFSKREDETGYHHWYQTVRRVEVSERNSKIDPVRDGFTQWELCG